MKYIRLATRWPVRSAVLALVVAASVPALAETTVFSTDFDGGVLPSAIDAGTAALTGVQGYAGLGTAGNTFGGQFLRSATANLVTLTLSNLPQHNAISVAFLFAAIDSLDGTGNFPSGDFLRIQLDGQTIFRESFANATPSQVQSYLPSAGAELARRVDLGFQGPGGFYTDSAYDLGAESALRNLSHTASTATFSWVIEGEGVQTLDDESWAMDRLRVSISPVPEPGSAALGLAGLGALGAGAWLRRRRCGAGR